MRTRYDLVQSSNRLFKYVEIEHWGEGWGEGGRFKVLIEQNSNEGEIWSSSKSSNRLFKYMEIEHWEGGGDRDRVEI